MLKHPGFVAGGILVLALGSGLNTAIFSLVNAILYRPLPVAAPEELRFVYTVSSQNLNRAPVGMLTYRHTLALREQRDLFADVMLVSRLRDRMRVDLAAERGQGEAVTSNYFDLLGVEPVIGRGFDWDDHETTIGERVVVISYDLWKTRFLGDPHIIGRTIALSDSGVGTYAPWRLHTIVGVMPSGFRGVSSPWESTQYWVPFLRHAADVADAERQMRPRSIIGASVDHGGLPILRLRAGVTSSVAAARVRTFGEQVRQEAAPNVSDWNLQLYESRAVRFPFDPRGRIVPSRLAAALLAVSGVVLFIAAANLAGMLLARSVTRSSELALRLTLGASRSRIVRQLVTESLLLSLAGSMLGVIVARWLLDLFIAGTPSTFVRWQMSAVTLDVPIDGRVLLFTTMSCVATALFIGLIPARQALRVDLLAALAGQATGSTAPLKRSLQRWVVVPQVCLSLALLLVAGVLIRTLIRDEARSPGYDATDVVLLDFDMPRQPNPPVSTKDVADRSRTERLARIQRVLERARSTAGVTDVTMVATAPMMPVPLPWMNTWIAARAGFKPDGKHFWAARLDATPEYFATLRIALLRGRLFDDRDRRGAPAVTIVSNALARRMWPGEDPIGQHLAQHTPESPYAPAWLEVVGVVRDVHLPLSDEDWSPAYYVPIEQGMDFASTLAARGDGSAAELLEGLKAAIAAADRDAIPSNARLMTDGLGEILYPRRLAAAILALAGALGLLLASTGVYGLISYSVAQRIREIGVRMALGADRRDVLRLIVGEGVGVAGIGLALGFAVTFIAVRIISRFVVALPPMDIGTLVVVPAILSGVILLASCVPALRAARIDPSAVLRGL